MVMNVYYCLTKRDLQDYASFRYNLYKKDPFYCDTDSFIFEMLLYKQTSFANSCVIKSLLIKENKKIVAQTLLIHNPQDDFVQVAFFECVPNNQEGANLVIEEAKKFAKEQKVKKIIIGIDGHLSYAVGLSKNMEQPNTFGASYTKTYYRDYFKKYNTHKLYSFSNSLDFALRSFKDNEKFSTDLTVRPINMKNFKKEMEVFGYLCDQTLGTTFLYSKTNSEHFYELMKDMTFFLRKENILFVYDKDTPVGFVFWNPDYNEVLPKGKKLSLLEIAFHYTFKKKRITRVTLNSIGVLEEYRRIATTLLVKEIKKYLSQDYYKNVKTFESSFIWEDNKSSMLLTKHILKNVNREYEVFEINL